EQRDFDMGNGYAVALEPGLELEGAQLQGLPTPAANTQTGLPCFGRTPWEYARQRTEREFDIRILVTHFVEHRIHGLQLALLENQPGAQPSAELERSRAGWRNDRRDEARAEDAKIGRRYRHSQLPRRAIGQRQGRAPFDRFGTVDRKRGAGQLDTVRLQLSGKDESGRGREVDRMNVGLTALPAQRGGEAL